MFAFCSYITKQKKYLEGSVLATYQRYIAAIEGGLPLRRVGRTTFYLLLKSIPELRLSGKQVACSRLLHAHPSWDPP